MPTDPRAAKLVVQLAVKVVLPPTRPLHSGPELSEKATVPAGVPEPAVTTTVAVSVTVCPTSGLEGEALADVLVGSGPIVTLVDPMESA